MIFRFSIIIGLIPLQRLIVDHIVIHMWNFDTAQAWNVKHKCCKEIFSIFATFYKPLKFDKIVQNLAKLLSENVPQLFWKCIFLQNRTLRCNGKHTTSGPPRILKMKSLKFTNQLPSKRITRINWPDYRRMKVSDSPIVYS